MRRCCDLLRFGCRAVDQPDLVARLLDGGHAVQPHCWAGHHSHGAVTKRQLDEDVTRTLDALASLGCPARHCGVPPNGDIKDPDSYEVAREHGWQLVTWTLQSCDWSDTHEVARILADIDAGARNDTALRADEVILMHDTMDKTPDLAVRVMERITSRGDEVGLLARDSAAAAASGVHHAGRTDGLLSCRP